MPAKKDIDLAKLEQLCRLQCTDEEIAAFFSVNVRTIERKRKDDPDFNAAIEKGKRTGLLSLRRAQYQAALNGNSTMLVWLGKNLLNQTDKLRSELSGPDGKAIEINSSDVRNEITSRIASLASRIGTPDDPEIVQ